MNELTDILFYTMIMIFFTFGIGLLYEIVNKQNAKLLQKVFGWNGFCFICCIGTIIHELSHLVVCLIFLHVPTCIELFRPVKGKNDGCLGKVEHSFKRTKFQMAGNFFIGCAPMIFGSIISIAFLYMIGIDVMKIASALLNNNINQILKYLNFDYQNPFSYLILFFIISIAISMDMSKADVKNAFFGCIPLFIVIVSIYMLIKLFTTFDVAIISEYIKIGVMSYIELLIIGLLISAIVLLLNFFLAVVVKIIKK